MDTQQYEVLANFYQAMVHYHSATGLVAKICLGCTLLAIERGNRSPSFRLLSAVFSVQFLAAFYLSAGHSVTIPVSVVCIVLAIAAGANAVQPEGLWRVLPPAGSARWASLAVLFWAFWYPVWADPRLPTPWFESLFFSPMGAIPQPTLLVALVLVWNSFPNGPRLFSWAVVAGAVALGVIDLVVTTNPTSILLLVGGLATGWRLWKTVSRVGFTEFDRPPAEVAQERASTKVATDAAKPTAGKVWKLK